MKYLILSLLLLTGCTNYHMFPSDHELAIDSCQSHKGVKYFYISNHLQTRINIMCKNGMIAIRNRNKNTRKN